MERGCFWFLSIQIFWKARICILYHRLYSPHNCLSNRVVSDVCLFLVFASLIIRFFLILWIKFFIHINEIPLLLFLFIYFERKKMLWFLALLITLFSPFSSIRYLLHHIDISLFYIYKLKIESQNFETINYEYFFELTNINFFII